MPDQNKSLAEFAYEHARQAAGAVSKPWSVLHPQEKAAIGKTIHATIHEFVKRTSDLDRLDRELGRVYYDVVHAKVSPSGPARWPQWSELAPSDRSLMNAAAFAVAEVAVQRAALGFVSEKFEIPVGSIQAAVNSGVVKPGQFATSQSGKTESPRVTPDYVVADKPELVPVQAPRVVPECTFEFKTGKPEEVGRLVSVQAATQMLSPSPALRSLGEVGYEAERKAGNVFSQWANLTKMIQSAYDNAASEYVDQYKASGHKAKFPSVFGDAVIAEDVRRNRPVPQSEKSLGRIGFEAFWKAYGRSIVGYQWDALSPEQKRSQDLQADSIWSDYLRTGCIKVTCSDPLRALCNAIVTEAKVRNANTTRKPRYGDPLYYWPESGGTERAAAVVRIHEDNTVDLQFFDDANTSQVARGVVCGPWPGGFRYAYPE